MAWDIKAHDIVSNPRGEIELEAMSKVIMEIENKY
jgi:hypothetical protein